MSRASRGDALTGRRRAVGAVEAEVAKDDCATVYGHAATWLVLGESFHPGGVSLSRRLADLLDLRPGATVVDVASGPGTTATLLAAEFGVRVLGVDLSPALVASAAGSVPPGLPVSFRVGDAERLPVPASTADAVLCECALCTFPDKDLAAGEFARILRPGGRLGVADVVIDPERLPSELLGPIGRVACLAEARPLAGYLAILRDAGLQILHVERHDEAVADMVGAIQGRLAVLEVLPWAADLDVSGWRRLAAMAADAIEGGAIGYALMLAGRGGR